MIISPLPFLLQNGTTADATEVMADFNAIVSDTNINAAENGINGDITQLTGLTTPLSPSQGGTQIWRAATMTSAANAITVTVSVPSSAPVVSAFYLALVSPITTTGSATLTSFALGAKTIKKWEPTTGKVNLIGGEIQSGNICLFYYDGTDYILTNPVAVSNVGTAPWPLRSGGSAALPSFQTKPATRQVFTSGSGTYTTATGATWIEVELIGGGGGGGGNGAPGTAGTVGNNTTFSTLTGGAGGGGGGGIQPNGGLGGSGGTAAGGDCNFPGGAGQSTGGSGNGNNQPGGNGGSGPFGGAGKAGNGTNAGGAGSTNTGAGGGGAGENAANPPGAGGGSGGYVRAIIAAPAATYSYAVGAGGGGGAGTTAAGGAGATGIVVVTEHYD